jgi:hypothetical protein
MMLVPKVVSPPVAVPMRVAMFWLVWMSLVAYLDLRMVIMLRTPVLVSGSPLGFVGVFDPE